MIPRSFEDIAKSDIEALIANGVAERRTLDFKRETPGNSEKDRKEFLADVTSFANAQGGDILFGIDAPRGVATTIAGKKIDDPDKEVLRWEAPSQMQGRTATLLPQPHMLRTSMELQSDRVIRAADFDNHAVVRFVTADFSPSYVAVPTDRGWLLIEL